MSTGNPVVDIKVTLVDGKAHSVDSSDMAFQTAGGLALREAARDAEVVVLEPVDTVDVLIDDDYVGAVMGDLSSRRARVLGTEAAPGGRTVVHAEVPGLELLRYAVDLRSLSHGTGSFARRFARYEALPSHLAASSPTPPQRRLARRMSCPLGVRTPAMARDPRRPTMAVVRRAWAARCMSCPRVGRPRHELRRVVRGPRMRARVGGRVGGPGGGEQLAGVGQQLWQQLGLADHRDEVGVARPPRHHVLVQVLRQRPAGDAAEVEPDVEPVRLRHRRGSRAAPAGSAGRRRPPRRRSGPRTPRRAGTAAPSGGRGCTGAG